MSRERSGIARGAFYGSLALHLCLALLLVGTEFFKFKPGVEQGPRVQWIRARLVAEVPAAAPERLGQTAAQVDQRSEPPPAPAQMALEERRQQAEGQPKPQAGEQAPRQADEEIRRQAEVTPRAELERQRAETPPRQADERARLQAEAERQRAEQRARQGAEERARQQAQAEREARERAEAEPRRIEEERRKQAESERRRLQEEAERLAAEESARLEAELEQARQRQLAEESERLAQLEERHLAAGRQRLADHQARTPAFEGKDQGSAQRLAAPPSQLLSDSERYIPIIRERVRQVWERPLGSGLDLSAVVRVRLAPGGEVIPDSVQIIKSSGHTAFDQSVIAAVYKASPLPVPSGAAFEPFREFDLTFRPDR